MSTPSPLTGGGAERFTNNKLESAGDRRGWSARERRRVELEEDASIERTRGNSCGEGKPKNLEMGDRTPIQLIARSVFLQRTKRHCGFRVFC